MSTVVTVPGVVQFGGLPDGDYHVLAMCFDEQASVAQSLRDTGGPFGYIGASRTLVQVTRGRLTAPFEIELRTPGLIDPPIVLAAPLLLAIMVNC
jgi:AraC family transcriptional regulator